MLWSVQRKLLYGYHGKCYVVTGGGGVVGLVVQSHPLILKHMEDKTNAWRIWQFIRSHLGLL